MDTYQNGILFVPGVPPAYQSLVVEEASPFFKTMIHSDTLTEGRSENGLEELLLVFLSGFVASSYKVGRDLNSLSLLHHTPFLSNLPLTDLRRLELVTTYQHSMFLVIASSPTRFLESDLSILPIGAYRPCPTMLVKVNFLAVWIIAENIVIAGSTMDDDDDDDDKFVCFQRFNLRTRQWNAAMLEAEFGDERVNRAFSIDKIVYLLGSELLRVLDFAPGRVDGIPMPGDWEDAGIFRGFFTVSAGIDVLCLNPPMRSWITVSGIGEVVRASLCRTKLSELNSRLNLIWVGSDSVDFDAHPLCSTSIHLTMTTRADGSKNIQAGNSEIHLVGYVPFDSVFLTLLVLRSLISHHFT